MTGFKTKTVKQIIRKKIDKWLASIDGLSTSDMLKVKRDTIVTGGAVTSLLMGESPNDYDFYFKSKETALLVANYYADTFERDNEIKAKKYCPYGVEVIEDVIKNCLGEPEHRIKFKMKSAGIAYEGQGEYDYFENQSETAIDGFLSPVDEIYAEILENPIEVVEDLNQDLKDKKKPYRPVFISDNAVTLSNKVQIVIRFYGNPEEIHKNFDFIHATGYYDYINNNLNISSEALHAIMSKTLIYHGSLYPVATIFRLRKFLNRGWSITAGQLLKIVFQINKLDLQNRETLVEQLIGVDFAYMEQLLQNLNEKDGKIDDIYIARLIDEIFE